MNTLKSALSPAKALTRREGRIAACYMAARAMAGGVVAAAVAVAESTPEGDSSLEETQQGEQQAAVEITYEVISVLPRSFSRLYNRLINQVFSNVANLIMQEYKLARYLFWITLRCFFILLFVPFLVNLIAKQLLFQPINEFFWNHFQTDIFLNSYQEKQAFSEFKKYEEKIYFESIFFPFAISESPADVVSQKLLLGAPKWYRATKINAHLVLKHPTLKVFLKGKGKVFAREPQKSCNPKIFLQLTGNG
jgi:hypothetical protein